MMIIIIAVIIIINNTITITIPFEINIASQLAVLLKFRFTSVFTYKQYSKSIVWAIFTSRILLSIRE